MQCPCGKPACWRIWEAPLAFCQKHGRAWLTSEEKKIVGVALGADSESRKAREIPEAQDALLRFVARVERDASLWIRIKRRFNRWFGGER